MSGTAAASLDPLGGSFIDRNTYLFLIVLGIGVLAQRQIAWGSLFHQTRWLWVFYAYLLLSVVWSDIPFVAFKRWFKDFGNVVMILIILTEEDPIEAMRGVFVRCAYVLILVSVLFIKYYPDLGRYYHRWTWSTMYCGITTNKNSLGDSAMISGLFLLWSLVDFDKYRGALTGLHKVLPDLVVLALSVWLLSIAQSATSLTCFELGVAIFLGLRLRWIIAKQKMLAWVGVGVAVVMVAFTALADFRAVVAGVLNRDVTLTGRTDIWAAVLQLPTNPILGNGFASTWLTSKGAALAEDLGIPHSHNGYLETYLNSGWIGVCLLIPILLAGGRIAIYHLSLANTLGYLFMALFVVCLVYNYTEVAFNTNNIVGFAVWLLAAFEVRGQIASRGADSGDWLQLDHGDAANPVEVMAAVS